MSSIYLNQYPVLNTYPQNDLKNTMTYLTDAIHKYQSLEGNLFKQISQNDDPNYQKKQTNFLQQQKLLNLQSERDGTMQKLVDDYQKNTQYYDAAIKLNSDANYIKSLQNTLYTVNSNKLGAINSDLMTSNRVASINTEEYRAVANTNQYLKMSIIFECVVIIILVLAHMNLSFLPAIALKSVLIVVTILFLIVLAIRAYYGRSKYRMLTVEKDFLDPQEAVEETSSCGCPTTS